MASERVTQMGYELLRTDYERLIELCLFHVLVPQGEHDAARRLLNADTILCADKKAVRENLNHERKKIMTTTIRVLCALKCSLLVLCVVGGRIDR